jgi:hypothetical protein
MMIGSLVLVFFSKSCGDFGVAFDGLFLPTFPAFAFCHED